MMVPYNKALTTLTALAAAMKSSVEVIPQDDEALNHAPSAVRQNLRRLI